LKQRKNENKQQDKQNKFTYKQLQEPEQIPTPKNSKGVGKQKSRKEKDQRARTKTLLNTTPQPREAKQDHKRTQQKTTNKRNLKTKRTRDTTDNQEPVQDKLFTTTTNKVVTMLKYKGARALDELVGSNKGKIRLISRADEKTYKKGKRSGSIFRAERVNTVHEMTTKEARNTEVSTTGTARSLQQEGDMGTRTSGMTSMMD
jgi:phosphoribosyl-AMP cyclohydrolase